MNKPVKPTKAPAAPKRLTEEDIRKKHPKANIVEGTLLYVDPANKTAKAGGRKVNEDVYTKHPNKQVIMINTVDEHGKPDGHNRWVATSDLHHVKMTEETAKAVRLARLKEARAKRRAAKPKVAKAPKPPKAAKPPKAPKAPKPPKAAKEAPAAPVAALAAVPATAAVPPAAVTATAEPAKA
jgi:hypothetical protein